MHKLALKTSVFNDSVQNCHLPELSISHYLLCLDDTSIPPGCLKAPPPILHTVAKAIFGNLNLKAQNSSAETFEGLH